MNRDTRCSATVYSGSWLHASQCSRQGSVTRDGKLFCRQHDPQAKNEKEVAKRAKRQAIDNAEHALEADAKRLLSQLGVTGGVYRAYDVLRRRFVTRPDVVISFSEVKRLLERLTPEACTSYGRPVGMMGGPCMTCGRSQPEHQPLNPLTESLVVPLEAPDGLGRPVDRRETDVPKGPSEK